jgi:hypothetical protein
VTKLVHTRIKTLDFTGFFAPQAWSNPFLKVGRKWANGQKTVQKAFVEAPKFGINATKSGQNPFFCVQKWAENAPICTYKKSFLFNVCTLIPCAMKQIILHSKSSAKDFSFAQTILIG